MTPLTAAIGSAVIVAVVFTLIIGRINHVHDQRHKAQTAIIFHQQETIEHLEQQANPMYVLRSDGVDCVVERGRPDIPPRRRATVPPGSVLDFTDLDDIPEWSSE